MPLPRVSADQEELWKATIESYNTCKTEQDSYSYANEHFQPIIQ